MTLHVISADTFNLGFHFRPFYRLRIGFDLTKWRETDQSFLNNERERKNIHTYIYKTKIEGELFEGDYPSW